MVMIKKLLIISFLICIIIILAVGLFFVTAPKNPQKITPLTYSQIKKETVVTTPKVTILPTLEATITPTLQQQTLQYKTTSSNMLILINAQRSVYGLPALQEISVLDRSALLKATDLQTAAWSHYDSKGRWFTGFFQDAGFYNKAAEILAKGYATDQDTINAWMASPEHRQAILEPHAVYFGYAQQGTFRIGHFGAAN